MINFEKSNKGFTLVELLAVIVILAVVILIAVTSVIPRMNNARRKAFFDEALVYLKAGKEIYATESTDCFNISDLSNYVKNDKGGYSGTLYVNSNGVTLNLTNGKYYIVTNEDASEYNVVNTKPSDFITSCSDNTKTYLITYDLDGGTLSSSNPSSYSFNTPTFTLNNPTKSGYRFVGWSGGKNLFNEKGWLSGVDGITYVDGHYTFKFLTLCNLYGCKGTANKTLPFESFKENTRYSLSVEGRVEDGVLAFYFDYTNDTYQYTGFNSKTETRSAYVSVNGRTISDLRVAYSKNSIAYVSKIQFEEGSAATSYEPYVDRKLDVSIHRGSSGNRTYKAIWEAI